MRCASVEKPSSTGLLARLRVLLPPRLHLTHLARSAVMLGPLSLALCGGCGGPPQPSATAAAQPAPLRVLLYPYLPMCPGDAGFSSTAARMSREFTAQTGRPVEITIEDVEGAIYDPTALGEIIAEGRYDVVEVDSETLGSLAETGAIQPWPAPPSLAGWHPAAVAAGELDGARYGVPHYLCGYFVFAYEAAPTAADTAAALGEALAALGTPRPDIVGDGMGSWTLASMYIDAWRELHPGASGPDLTDGALDPAAAQAVVDLLRLCRHDGAWPCVDPNSGFDDSPRPAEIFGAGQADAMWGYSERLHHVIAAARAQGLPDPEVHIAPAPLAGRREMMTFTDVLTLRRGCEGDCASGAGAFAAYLTDPATLEWLLMADECPTGTPPRYLLPARLSGYTPRLMADPHYPRFRALMSSAAPYPIRGVVEARRRIEAFVKGMLGR